MDLSSSVQQKGAGPRALYNEDLFRYGILLQAIWKTSTRGKIYLWIGTSPKLAELECEGLGPPTYVIMPPLPIPEERQGASEKALVVLPNPRAHSHITFARTDGKQKREIPTHAGYFWVALVSSASQPSSLHGMLSPHYPAAMPLFQTTLI